MLRRSGPPPSPTNSTGPTSTVRTRRGWSPCSVRRRATCAERRRQGAGARESSTSPWSTSSTRRHERCTSATAIDAVPTLVVADARGGQPRRFPRAGVGHRPVGRRGRSPAAGHVARARPGPLSAGPRREDPRRAGDDCRRPAGRRISVMPCWIRRATSGPSMVSCSSSASATRSRPRRCWVRISVARLLLLGEDPGDLLVDQLGGVVAVLATRGHQVLAEEHLLLAAPRHRADRVAHAPLAHHAAGDAGGLFEVVGGAGVEMAEDDLLGDAAAHRLADRVLEVLLGVGVALLREAST